MTDVIYQIYKPIGVFGKYLGIVQLKGLYEGSMRNVIPKCILNQLVPLFHFLLLLFFGFNMVWALIEFYYNGVCKSQFDFFINFNITFGNALLAPTVFLIYYFNGSDLTAKYLKAHGGIQQLIAPKKRQLKHYSFFAFLFFDLLCILRNLTTFCFRWYGPDASESDKSLEQGNLSNLQIFILIILLFSVFLAANVDCQLQMSYILFQKVLQVAFTELIEEIKTNRRLELNPIEIANRFGVYRRLNLHICKLSKRLENCFSSMIALQFAFFVGGYTLTFCYFDGLLSGKFKYCLPHLIQGFICFCPLIFCAYGAQNTSDLAANVLPTLMSSLNLDSKRARLEFGIFANQVIVCQPSFTAGGFFKINKEIILSIASSILSYGITFLKIKKSLS